MLNIEQADRLIKQYAEELLDIHPNWFDKAASPFNKSFENTELSVALSQISLGRVIAVWSPICPEDWLNIQRAIVNFPCQDAESPLTPLIWVFENNKPCGVVALSPSAAIIIAYLLPTPHASVELQTPR